MPSLNAIVNKWYGTPSPVVKGNPMYGQRTLKMIDLFLVTAFDENGIRWFVQYKKKEILAGSSV